MATASVKVRALQPCFVDNRYRNKGDVFVHEVTPGVTEAVDREAKANGDAKADPVADMLD